MGTGWERERESSATSVGYRSIRERINISRSELASGWI
ncbi:unnamed protein product [Spirodela intermedia]|uniref:Uncharacterized protein n=1 Tax=Spirodela intermedia TaxID=51605 RepID=A0A7I8K771_SPIIN|nr:unnamed protein product [Spirodela intermedia]